MRDIESRLAALESRPPCTCPQCRATADQLQHRQSILDRLAILNEPDAAKQHDAIAAMPRDARVALWSLASFDQLGAIFDELDDETYEAWLGDLTMVQRLQVRARTCVLPDRVRLVLRPLGRNESMDTFGGWARVPTDVALKLQAHGFKIKAEEEYGNVVYSYLRDPWDQNTLERVYEVECLALLRIADRPYMMFVDSMLVYTLLSESANQEYQFKIDLLAARDLGADSGSIGSTGSIQNTATTTVVRGALAPLARRPRAQHNDQEASS